MDTSAVSGLVAITREPGVADLPSKVKARFAMAIKAERAGRSEVAGGYYSLRVTTLRWSGSDEDREAIKA